MPLLKMFESLLLLFCIQTLIMIITLGCVYILLVRVYIQEIEINVRNIILL